MVRFAKVMLVAANAGSVELCTEHQVADPVIMVVKEELPPGL
jgi:hypothetical protein